MKQIYFLFTLILTFNITQAQIIDIPDANFKSALVNDVVTDLDGNGIPDGDIDINNDGEIQESEAAQITWLILTNKNISSLEGIQFFPNIETLWLNNNLLTDLDVTQNLNLKYLLVKNNQLTSLNISQNLNLEQLVCSNNQLTSINLTQNTLLNQLNCDINQLTQLDVTQNVNLEYLICTDNALTNLDVSLNSILKTLTITDNQLTSLDVSQNTVLEVLNCSSNELVNLNLGIGLNLQSLGCAGNLLESLDASQKPNLQTLNCNSNQLTSINISQTPALEYITCNDNLLTVLDVSESPSLNFLQCEDNQIEHLDLSQNINLFAYDDNPSLTKLKCKNNQMQTLILKNGINNVQAYATFYNFFEGNETLTYICDDVDHLSYLEFYISSYYPNATTTVNSYCSFNPGGEFYTVSGNNTYDLNGDGCDASDLNFPNLKYNVTDGIIDETIFSNNNGDYILPVQAGMHTITPLLENTPYFTVVPASVTVDFPTDESPYFQDFCVTPDGVHSDLEIIIIPIEQARPGFDTDYELVYKNKGNTTLSGMVTLDFQDDFMDLVTANPIADTQITSNLSWNYIDLLPFETKSIYFTMNVNTPTDTNYPVNGDDLLSFTAIINPISGDELPEDNVFELYQTVVNSFDPNDKTCLEGKIITPDKVGDYVHYMIRFENTGTASAVNIVVKDEIDLDKFDVSTLKPITGSHSFVTRIRDTNIVEFIFEDINLPEDDANNDGYIIFKIKTLSTLELGDTFANGAEIYFDFNAPIITNIASTMVEESLSVEEVNFNSGISIYPNPVKENLFIESQKGIVSVSIYDINGRLIEIEYVSENPFEKRMNVTRLNSGIYFLKIILKSGEITKKIIKN